jgi:hypothetical protein
MGSGRVQHFARRRVPAGGNEPPGPATIASFEAAACNCVGHEGPGVVYCGYTGKASDATPQETRPACRPAPAAGEDRVGGRRSVTLKTTERHLDVYLANTLTGVVLSQISPAADTSVT